MGNTRVTCEIISGQATTTTLAQQAVLATYSIPENRVFYVEAIVLGKDANSMPIITKIYAGGYRATAGAILSGSGTIAAKIDPLKTGASMNVVAVGNEVRLVITAPVLPKLIEWQADFKVFIN